MADSEPVLAYLEAVSMSDGVYTLTVSDADGKTSSVNERALVGKAGWSSDVLGRFIRFVISPWGVCVMAVLPCLALILYAVLKGAADNRPLPEVVPQRKNFEEEKTAAASLGVNSDGNASYARSSGNKPSQSADSVLFTYGKPKSPATMKPSAPAVQKPTVTPKPASAPARKSPATMKPDVPAAKPAPKIASDLNEKKETKMASVGSVPSSVAAKRYLDSATAPQKKSSGTAPRSVEAAASVNGTTAEIPQLPKMK